MTNPIEITKFISDLNEIQFENVKKENQLLREEIAFLEGLLKEGEIVL
jgi:hypothetical protein